MYVTQNVLDRILELLLTKMTITIQEKGMNE